MGETTNLSEGSGLAPSQSQGRQLLRSFLNKNMKIKLTDGRILVGIFLCTDKGEEHSVRNLKIILFFKFYVKSIRES